MFNFGCLKFWFSFGQCIVDDNPVGSLWQVMPFVREKNAYTWEVYFINYITASLFLCQMEAICLSSFKYFSTHGENVYEQLTVYGVGGSLFSVLWNDFMSKRNMFLLLYQQHNPFHLELNLKHRVFHFGCEVWRLGNISRYILGHPPVFR